MNPHLEPTFEVTGLGESHPLVIANGNAAIFLNGASICAQERALIDAEIASFSIPLPQRPLMKRPKGPILVNMRTAALTRTEISLPSIEYPTVDFSADEAPVVVSWWKQALDTLKLQTGIGHASLSVTAKTIDEAARRGEILLVGDRLQTVRLVRLLKNKGRAVKVVTPDETKTDEPVLSRPKSGTMMHHLLHAMGDLDEVGAIVLVGHRGIVESSGALADVTNCPPVLKVDLLNGAPPRVVEFPVSVDRPPKITIVSVSYNQADYLEASIRSVLDQNYPNLEYIIVDGASTDGSIAIIERYRRHFAHVIIEKDNGQSEALNKGFRLATGDVMNWLCSDDLLVAGSLQVVADVYRKNNADIISGGCLRIRESLDDVIARHHSSFKLGRDILVDPYDVLMFMGSWQKGNYFFQPEVFFSMAIWKAAGGYLKEHLFYAMDYDMWLRMALAGARIHCVAAPIGCSRVHDAQKTKDDRVYLHQLALMMDEYEAMFDALRRAAT